MILDELENPKKIQFFIRDDTVMVDGWFYRQRFNEFVF